MHRSIAILAAVTLAGGGTMTVELSAVRLLAPWFGTSAAVWTNVIGVVLLALALGYLLGARLSAGAAPVRRMGAALVLGAVATGWLPGLAAPLAEVFRPVDVALDQAAGVLLWGSLAASLLLFFPAAFALGCVGPLAVEAVGRDRKRGAGDAGGRVLAASTVGSFAGTFATTHWLLPELGLDGTFLLAAGVLGALGLLLVVAERPGRAGAAALCAGALATAAALVASRVRPPGVAEGERVLASVQSSYQTLRVVEREEDGRPFRLLQVNEGLDSFQSVWQPVPGLLPAGLYYNYFVLPAWWEEPRPAFAVCVLGLGAGTTWRVLEGALPPGTRLDATGVELDREVVALGRAWFDLPPEGPGRRALSGWDARAALVLLDGPFDEIVLDAYANQMEIPAHLATVEMFAEVLVHLRPGGWLAVNVGGFGLEDPVVVAVGATVAEAFGRRVLALRVPFSRNVVLVARREAEPPEPGSPGFVPAGPGAPARLAAPLELPGAWRWLEPGDGPRLTDRHSPIEALQRESVRRAAALLGSGP